MDYRNGLLSDIYAQKISNDGYPVWGENDVPVNNLDNNQVDPQLISDQEGNVIITWIDHHLDEFGDVFAQKLDEAGNMLWMQNGIAISTAANMQMFQKIIGDGNGGAIIAWSDMRSGEDFDIYAQWVDEEGNLGGISAAEDPQLTSNPIIALSQNYPNPFNPATAISFRAICRQRSGRCGTGNL